jgi:hypothetical protein
MQNHFKISPETIDSNVPEMNFHWIKTEEILPQKLEKNLIMGKTLEQH